jgi:ubiquinone/menaquinone biosynthesis C-methylase UbiE
MPDQRATPMSFLDAISRERKIFMPLFDKTVHKRMHKRLLRDTLGRTQRANLVRLISTFLPDQNTRVLDVGCGNGLFARDLMAAKPCLNITGGGENDHRDCLIRQCVYDGWNLPFPDKRFDYVLLINVLHHANDPAMVLAEAARVARHGIVIKDHYANTRLDFYTLVAMERIGNAFSDISQPYNFFSEKQWEVLFDRVGLRIKSVRNRFVCYNAILDFLFGRNLHFVANVVCPEG